MTVQQIEAILRGTEETLRLVLASREYQRLQASQYFTTSNDLTLGDAVQALAEVQHGISQVLKEVGQLHQETSVTQ